MQSPDIKSPDIKSPDIKSPDFQSLDFKCTAQGETISLFGSLNFSTAKQALTAVNEQMALAPVGDAGARVIDLAGITHSNSAGLALLIEWLAQAQRTNRKITFTNIPDSLHQISAVCQVDSLI